MSGLYQKVWAVSCDAAHYKQWDPIGKTRLSASIGCHRTLSSKEHRWQLGSGLTHTLALSFVPRNMVGRHISHELGSSDLGEQLVVCHHTT